MLALVAVYYSTFAVLGVLVLGFHEDLFDCSIAFKVNLYTILTTCLFYTFGHSFCVWDDYLSYCGLVSLSVNGWIAALVVVSCIAVVVVACVGRIVVACISVGWLSVHLE